MSNTATEKQTDLINRLKAEREPTTEAMTALSMGRLLWKHNAFTTEAASGVIEALLAAPKKATANEQPPEGMHKVGDKIFKVQRAVNGSGNLYAKRLLDDGGFAYAPGATKALTSATLMSLEDAQAYGRLYGRCCVCGRTLTDENSIAAGIGPVCAGKWSS